MTRQDKSEDALYLQTLGRGIEVLEILSAGPASLKEVCDQLGVNRSAAYRLVHTLTLHGLVVRHAATQRLHITPRLWELGVSAAGPGDLRSASRTAVTSLADKYGESVHLAVYNDGEVVYVDKADGWQPIRSYTVLGGRAPAYCVATGKVLLAAQADAEVERVLQGGLRKYTPQTITDRERLLAELRDTREAGFSVNQAEWRDSVAGVAVPLVGARDETVAALGFSGPVDRVLGRRTELLDALREAAEQVHRNGS